MKIGVSDHALMRFIERAGGFDVESLRGQIADSLERASKAAELLGQSDYTVKADGLVYVIVGGVCVTVLDREPGKRPCVVRRELAAP